MSHDDPNSILMSRVNQVSDLEVSGSQDLEYACNIPGHYESGMFGAVNFKP